MNKLINDKFKKHYFAVHTFVSDEARKEYMTPPEKKYPPEHRRSEIEWAETASGDHAQCLQTWVGNTDFFYCHWIANSEDDVYEQLKVFELEGKIINTMVNEVHQFMSTYRASKDIYEQFPENGIEW